MGRATYRLFVFAAILFFAGLSAAYAQTENRFALVIGNGAYPTSPLRNPVNDAQDMAAALRGVGFDVIHRENVNRSDMRAAVREFSKKIRQGGVGLFYFAGHGIQVDGSNFLIPVDANIEQEYEVADEALNASSVLRAMEDADNQLNIIILDACRNNPFARSFRSSSRGLAQMSAPTGSIVAYATAPGSVAADGEGRNGLYTKYLLDAMQTPGRTLEEVFKQVRINVVRDTSERQTPWEESSLTGDFYFRPGTAVAAAPAAAPPAAATSFAQPQVSSEARYWNTVKDSENPAEYNSYLQKYPDGEYADIAVARRDRYAGTATYVPSNIGQSNQRALINPVYYGNTENPYATVAVRDFVDTRTPFQVVEMNPVMAQTNQMNALRGIASVYPDNVDFVFTSKIIRNQSNREINPNYKASSALEKNFGKQLLNTLSSKSFRYYLVSNVDVEVRVLMPKENQQFTHIERAHYKVPLTDNANEQQLMTDAPINASVDALQAAMLKYNLPVLPEGEQQLQQQEEPKKPSLFDSILKSAINQ
jgi:hypothetical protein